MTTDKLESTINGQQQQSAEGLVPPPQVPPPAAVPPVAQTPAVSIPENWK